MFEKGKRLLTFVVSLVLILITICSAPIYAMTDNIRTVATTPKLGYYWAQDNNGNYTEDRSQGFNKEMLGASIHSMSPVFIYFIDENGKETLLDASQLISTDVQVVSVEDSNKGTGMVEMSYRSVGNASLNYNYNGTTYSINVSTQLPPVAMYSQNIANENYYIEDEYLISSSNNTFYLVASEDWKIDDISFDNGLDNIASCTMDTNKQLVTMTVNGVPEEGRYYNISLEASSVKNNYTFYGYFSIKITDKRPGLRFYWGDFDANNEFVENREMYNKEWFASPGYCCDIFVYYIDENGEIPVSASDLTTTDSSVVTVSHSPENSKAVRLETNDFGQADINFVKNGKTFSINVVSELPEIGFYNSSVADQSTYITDYKVLGNNNIFYLVSNGDARFKSIDLEAGFSDIANAVIDKSGKFVVVTVTGIPEDGYYGLDFVIECDNNGQMEERNGSASIELFNANPWYYDLEDMNMLLSEEHMLPSEITYRNSDLEDVTAQVRDIQVTGGDTDAIVITKMQDSGEVFWNITAMKVGTAEVTITHVDPSDHTKAIDYTYSITVDDKTLWITHEMMNETESLAVPGDTSERKLFAYLDYYDYDENCIKSLDVTNQAKFNWNIVNIEAASKNSKIEFVENVAKVTVAPDEMNGSEFWYECEITYDDNGQTYYVHMCDGVQVVDSYYCVEPIHIPNGFGFNEAVIVKPVVKRISYDYTTRQRSEMVVNDNLDIIWHKDIDEITILCNGTEVVNDQKMPYKSTDVITINRGELLSGVDFAVSFVIFDATGSQDVIGYYDIGFDEIQCPHPSGRIETINKEDASCTTDGYSGDKVCVVCDEVITHGTIVFAYGHDYRNGECIECKEKDPDYHPEKEVEVVVKEDTLKATDEVKTDIVSTVVESISNITAGGDITDEKLVEAVKKELVESKDPDVKAICGSVSEETLEKVISAIIEQKEISVKVVTKSLSAQEAAQKAKEETGKILAFVGEDGKVAQYLNLSVVIVAKDSDGNVETLGTVDEPTKEFSFTLSIPDELKQPGRTFYIIRVHDNGDAEKIPVVDNGDGTISFKTDKFSLYALAYTDQKPEEAKPGDNELEVLKPEDPNPEQQKPSQQKPAEQQVVQNSQAAPTGDRNNIMIYMMMLVICSIVIGGIVIKRFPTINEK